MKIKGNLITNKIKGLFVSMVDFFSYFKKGNYKTKLSYFVMGFGCFTNKQIFKGLIFLATEIAYFLYMLTSGGYYLSMLGNLGTKAQGEIWDESAGIYRYVKGDNSMLLLLFGVAAIFVTIFFLYIYKISVKAAYQNECLIKSGIRPQSFKDQWKALFNERFHITVLSLPIALTFLFTIVPLVFMILMAFTNFDKNHQPPGNLFTWVGLSNFSQVFYGNPLWAKTFLRLFVWTMIWAVFATFLNYFLGIILAIIINRKGIKFKKFWRTIFVITIAVPQFVSLLLMSNFLADSGALNGVLMDLHIIKEAIPFLTNANVAKITVIIVNLWVGIPYTMLICSGVLMNIPEDLYEASRIDGASPVRQFISITMPYMLQVTTPYLITQFVGNINNFNVIYLLTKGGPASLNLYQAGETDLLVTWLYKLTTIENNYALASTIGIIIFVITATISLITYNNTKAVKEEGQFQ
ncbi:MAG: sugar ABC transporter permease [Erysipelotrichaceae bacterium]|nr:sugar ABC transporter permease [Erysipelotrichaceae bacterium]